MPRRPHRHRDSRPSWDTPFLHCVRDYRMGDGTRRTEIDPDYERRYREHLLQTTQAPSWHHDPTYSLRRKPRHGQ
jgi:hypothetical protein